MLGTVRTSRCNASEERLDDRSRDRERERFDKLPLVPDEDSAMMRRERRHDVLMLQFAADEVFGAVEFNATVGVHLADERNPALGDRSSQVSSVIKIMLETEGGRKMTECRPELIAEYSREAGSVVSHGETPAGLPDVIILEE